MRIVYQQDIAPTMLTVVMRAVKFFTGFSNFLRSMELANLFQNQEIGARGTSALKCVYMMSFLRAARMQSGRWRMPIPRGNMLNGKKGNPVFQARISYAKLTIDCYIKKQTLLVEPTLAPIIALIQRF